MLQAGGFRKSVRAGDRVHQEQTQQGVYCESPGAGGSGTTVWQGDGMCKGPGAGGRVPPWSWEPAWLEVNAGALRMSTGRLPVGVDLISEAGRYQEF